jgi:hypothetical protein
LKLGAEGRARTADPTLFRRMLYQLSYLGIFFLLYYYIFPITKPYLTTKTAISAYFSYCGKKFWNDEYVSCIA